eukprot:TRINITY_DN32642_c0_g1_i1.p2 TRINITY_DN32642_c0_g1~~TRINITY_DN32642_c0_g1_i1.p2  ORF type:complete len:201 (+),score=63.06 TRINITY_DN32642_c0_g1_i1:265-867(+)
MCGVALSRLQLGMHSPIDLWGGLVTALATVAAYVQFMGAVDAFIDSPSPALPVATLLLSCVPLVCYPTPLKDTPSYQYCTYFMGTSVGVVVGIWGADEHHDLSGSDGPLSCSLIKHALVTPRGLAVLAARVVVGMVVVLAAREVTKQLLTVMHNGAKRVTSSLVRPIDLTVAVRLFTYAAVGFVVVDPCMWCFKHYLPFD